jgi:hypothetical protein
MLNRNLRRFAASGALLVGLCLAASADVVPAADDPPSDAGAKVSAGAKNVAEAVKRDAKVVAQKAKEGAKQVAASSKEIAHHVAASSKQGAHNVADAAKRGAAKTRAAFKSDGTGKDDKQEKPENGSDHKPRR